MNAIVDRCINVPLLDEDIENTIDTLPRPPDKSGVVAVKLKRKMELKGAHMEAFVRPQKLIDALKKLKELGNPHYQDIKIDKDFLSKGNGMCTEDNESNDDDSGTEINESDSSDEEEEADILEAVRKQQSNQNCFTCLVPMNPQSDVVLKDNKTVEKNQATFELAPGEGKIPVSWLHQMNFDVMAYPKHHPSGNFGIHHEREIPLTPQMYFNARLLGDDQRFSRDIPYLFMAQQYCERWALERQIDISGQKGISSFKNGQMEVHLKDEFSIFQNIKGTPKYWQKAKNELIAKVKNLGPFHIFFTLSCGEMRWSEVFVSVLRSKGYNVDYLEDEHGWNGSDENIFVDGNKKLWDFVSELGMSKHEFLKDSVVLITRQFDERVKSFIKNILMGPGKDKIPIDFYNYRVEFQARGNCSFIIFLNFDGVRPL